MQNLTLITILTLLLSSSSINAQTTITDTGQLRNAINTVIVPNNVRNITASKMNWIMNGVVNVFGKSCNQYFGNIQGSVSDNSALAAALAGKQNTLPGNQLLDIKNYYLDGHQSLRNFADDARMSLNARYDSSNYGFISFSDTSNAMLNKGVITNIDSFPMFGGFYRYSPSNTGGTRPTSGGLGVVMNIVAQDLKFSRLGEGRVYQFAMDGSINKSFLRYYNGSWSSWDTIYTSSYHPGSDGGGGSSYLPLTGGSLSGNIAQITFPRQTPGITYPTNNDIQIGNTNGRRFYFADSSGGGSSLQFDLSGITGNKVITWDNAAGTPILMGNSFNAANSLVKLSSSGFVPAASVAIASISATGTASSTTYLRGDGSWATPSGGSGNVLGTVFIGGQNNSTLTSGKTTYGIISGNAATGTLSLKSVGIGESGTLSNFYLFTTDTQSATGTLVATLYKNGAATAISITIPAGSSANSYNDNTHTVAVYAGDTFAWQFVNNATETSLTIVNTSLTFKQ